MPLVNKNELMDIKTVFRLRNQLNPERDYYIDIMKIAHRLRKYRNKIETIHMGCVRFSLTISV